MTQSAQLALLCAATALAADPVDLLRRTRANALNGLARLPRYSCTQTVDRVQYTRTTPVRKGAACGAVLATRPAGTGLVLQTSDRLRLDVGLAADGEMYSWVGESRFQDRSVFDMIGEGAFSNGSFAAFLQMILRDDAADFHYVGRSSGRGLEKYDYFVPLPASHYKVGSSASTTTGYRGSLSIYAETASIAELTISTEDLSTDSGACYASTSLRYAPLSASGTALVLPAETILRVVNADGSETENRTVYTGCREFVAESSVSFGTASPRTGHPEPVHPVIPVWLPLTLALATDIDTATAAAGDSIDGVLATPLRDGNRIIAPEGTPVLARIAHVKFFFRKRVYLVLALRLESLILDGCPVPLSAVEDLRTKATLDLVDGYIAYRGVRLGPLNANAQPRLGILVFENAKPGFVVPRGYKTRWMTTAE